MDTELQKLAPTDFPSLLREIPDAPKSLYLRGVLPDFTTNKWITVVGTRAYTSYGKQVVDHLISGLASYPVVIVSGLALGIDGLAHEAALRAGLATVAVPGSGLGWDVLYPRTNFSLGKRIIEAGGAHLSEYEPGFRAERWSFLQRNRIMAGISHATLVIEANERSGTLVTARLATDYNRDVLVVPGSIFSEASKGNNLYLRHGATPVTNSDDILNALGIEKKDTARTGVSDEEEQVLDLLLLPLTRDELTQQLHMPAAALNILLSSMELKGFIAEESGHIRSLLS